MKEFKDCMEFANQNPMCYMATNEGDQPRVRAMGMYEADENNFTFHTGFKKALAKGKLKGKIASPIHRLKSIVGKMVRKVRKLICTK